ncbi:MAG TPA: nucleotide exchange factor GrpE [Candidatus Limnocylindrales bacterium]
MPDRQTTPRIHHRGAGGDWPGRPAAAAPAQADEQLTAELDHLRAELEAARAEVAEHKASLQRTAADFANYRRRTAEDRERELGLAGESLLRKVLAVADDFDRALDAMPDELKAVSWIEGIVLLDRKLRALLESEGVTPIEAVGRPFDPREHEAIASVPATGRPDGEVVAEVQRGYRVRDRVLRPAMVAVAGGDEAAHDDANSHIN